MCTFSLLHQATWEGFELEIDYSAFTSEEHLALIVHVDDTDNGTMAAKSAYGLILRFVAGNKDKDKKYERVGMFKVTALKFSRLQAWDSKTLKLI